MPTRVSIHNQTRVVLSYYCRNTGAYPVPSRIRPCVSKPTYVGMGNSNESNLIPGCPHVLQDDQPQQGPHEEVEGKGERDRNPRGQRLVQGKREIIDLFDVDEQDSNFCRIDKK